MLRVLAATALVALAPTLYFTFSRGALLALAVGSLAMFALSPQRLRLLAGAPSCSAPIPAVGVLLASRALPALTHQSIAVSCGEPTRAHRLALELALLAAAQAVVAAAYVVWLSADQGG